MDNLCPCGSEKDINECCGAIISGRKEALTAEELMRSRYTAFTRADINYLVKTQSTSAGLRKEKERKKLKRWAQSVEWLYLSVMKVIDGGENDEKGTVIFRAFYIQNEEYDNIYEESFFEKKDGKWMYVDGVDLNMENEEKLFSGN
jgi:SEC-C motif-containing protein